MTLYIRELDQLSQKRRTDKELSNQLLIVIRFLEEQSKLDDVESAQTVSYLRKRQEALLEGLRQQQVSIFQRVLSELNHASDKVVEAEVVWEQPVHVVVRVDKIAMRFQCEVGWQTSLKWIDAEEFWRKHGLLIFTAKKFKSQRHSGSAPESGGANHSRTDANVGEDAIRRPALAGRQISTTAVEPSIRQDKCMICGERAIFGQGVCYSCNPK